MRAAMLPFQTTADLFFCVAIVLRRRSAKPPLYKRLGFPSLPGPYRIVQETVITKRKLGDEDVTCYSLLAYLSLLFDLLPSYPRVEIINHKTCRIQANAGTLTNCELLDMLKSRGAAKETRVIAPVAPSEFKVYDYLVGTVACNQTREHINEFLKKSKKYKLAKSEILNIINTRPSQLVELYLLIEQQEEEIEQQRPELDMEELLELILEVLPPHPIQPELADETAKETGETVPIEEDE